MATQKAKDGVEVLDESSDDKSDPAEEFGERISREMAVFSKAASIYFESLHGVHKDSEAEKSKPEDVLKGAEKAHKAAWRHVLENSETHKEHQKAAKKVLPDSAFDGLDKWLDDSDS